MGSMLYLSDYFTVLAENFLDAVFAPDEKAYGPDLQM